MLNVKEKKKERAICQFEGRVKSIQKTGSGVSFAPFRSRKNPFSFMSRGDVGSLCVFCAGVLICWGIKASSWLERQRKLKG